MRLLLLTLALVAASVPAAAQQVVPTVDCVEETEDGRYRAYFGYETTGTTPITVPLGDDNRYQGGRTDDVPETTFAPGIRQYAFEATFENRLTWSIGTDGSKRMVRADQRHPNFNACAAPGDSDNEPESDGVLSLVGASASSFNAVGPRTLTVRVEGASFYADPEAHRAVVNGTYLVPTSVTPSELGFGCGGSACPTRRRAVTSASTTGPT